MFSELMILSSCDSFFFKSFVLDSVGYTINIFFFQDIRSLAEHGLPSCPVWDDHLEEDENESLRLRLKRLARPEAKVGCCETDWGKPQSPRDFFDSLCIHIYIHIYIYIYVIYRFSSKLAIWGV